MVIYQKGGDYREKIIADVEQLIIRLSDRKIACETILQSGLAYRWYLTDSTNSFTSCVSKLCNTLLSLHQSTSQSSNTEFSANLEVMFYL